MAKMTLDEKKALAWATYRETCRTCIHFRSFREWGTDFPSRRGRGAIGHQHGCAIQTRAFPKTGVNGVKFRRVFKDGTCGAWEGRVIFVDRPRVDRHGKEIDYGKAVAHV